MTCMTEHEDVQPDAVERLLSKDVRKAAALLTPGEVRYLVDLYYQFQNFRISSRNCIRAGEDQQEPNAALSWFSGQIETVEGQVRSAMKYYARGRRDGRWALSIHGIGPVIAAGMLANFDIQRAPTVGHFWSFAGLNPDAEWKKGQKRPFSLKAKVVAWKAGQSFMKLRAGKNDVYGKLYAARKALEIERNEAGAHKGYMLRTAAGVKEVDKLPPFIIDARARRWAVKLFIAHLHHVMHEVAFGTPPMKPYILTKGDHAHYMGPPNWPID